jgi:hypothetical protein
MSLQHPLSLWKLFLASFSILDCLLFTCLLYTLFTIARTFLSMSCTFITLTKTLYSMNIYVYVLYYRLINKTELMTVLEAIWQDLPQDAIDLAVLSF